MLSTMLVVFGPCDGFRAFCAPEFSEVNDDSLALSSANFQLNRDGVLIRIERILGPGGNTRISIYKQVFEPNLDRLGHSFGVSLAIHGGYPEARSVVEVLVGLLEILRDECVNNGRFVDTRRFKEFLSKHKQIFGNAIASLRQIASEISPNVLTSKNCLAYWIEAGEDFLDQKVISLVDWFYSSPSALLCDELFISQRAAGTPGTLVQPLPDNGVLNEKALKLFWNFYISQSSQSKIKEKEFEEKCFELSKLIIENDRLIDEAKMLQIELSRLNSENSALRSQPKHSLVDADFERFRSILKQCLALNIAQSTQPLTPQESSDNSITSYKTDINWLMVGLSTIGGLLGLLALVWIVTQLRSG